MSCGISNGVGDMMKIIEMIKNIFVKKRMIKHPKTVYHVSRDEWSCYDHPTYLHFKTESFTEYVTRRKKGIGPEESDVLCYLYTEDDALYTEDETGTFEICEDTI